MGSPVHILLSLSLSLPNSLILTRIYNSMVFPSILSAAKNAKRRVGCSPLIGPCGKEFLPRTFFFSSDIETFLRPPS